MQFVDASIRSRLIGWPSIAVEASSHGEVFRAALNTCSKLSL
jgi:hypothetical protein